MADKPRICMVGSSNIDLISRVPRLPMPGETLIGSTFQMGFGGKGANQAVMAAKLGAQVSVVTKLGRDIFGDDTLKNYQKFGIDTTYLLFDETRFSGVAPIAVDEKTGQNSIIIVPGANNGLSPADVRMAAPAIHAAQILICQLEIPLETTLEAFRVAKEGEGVTTILNPAPAATLSDELIALSDIIAPNEVEAAMLTKLPTDTDDLAVKAGRALQKRGASIVVMTLGVRGALILDKDADPVFVAAQKVQAVDSTGAGDAFVGSLAYFLGVGRDLADAVERACAIATRSVLKAGTQISFPMRAEVLEIMGE
ncbi:MAG: ribokinase [Chloroflexota bacterium]|nr:ribokinase [Chloroflexota bacterium]